LHYSVDADGSLELRASGPLPPAADGLGRLAVSPDGRSLYVTGNLSGFSSLIQYTIAANGALALKSPATVPTAPAATDLAVSPNGRSAYVTNSAPGQTSAVWQYSAHADGTLSPNSPATVPTQRFATGVAVSPDSRSVYVVNFRSGPGLVSQYTAGADGTLSPKSPSTVPAGRNPDGIAISPDGQGVYVTDATFTSTPIPGRVSQYAVTSGGKLIPQSPAVVRSGIYPGGIGVHPDGRSLYAANAGGFGTGSGSISQYTLGTDGRLSPKAPAMVPGGNPGSIAISREPASVSVVGTVLSVEGALGARDNLAITRPSPSTLRVADFPRGVYTGSVVEAGNGCTQSGPYAANCPMSGITPSLPMLIEAADQMDRVANSTGLPSRIYGGTDDDTLVGGSDRDIMNGGPGVDVIKALEANDLLRAHDGTSDRALDCGDGSDKADLDQRPLDGHVSGCEVKTRH
jgi:DNA-binding beta-propeller fold protein YncE